MKYNNQIIDQVISLINQGLTCKQTSSKVKQPNTNNNLTTKQVEHIKRYYTKGLNIERSRSDGKIGNLESQVVDTRIVTGADLEYMYKQGRIKGKKNVSVNREDAPGSINSTPDIVEYGDILDTLGIDLDNWEVVRQSAGTYKDGTPRNNLSLVRRTDNLQRIKDQLINDMSNHAPVYKPRKYKVYKDAVMLELGVFFDWHYGKKAWGEETGDNYDTGIAERLADKAMDYILNLAGGFNIDRILLPLGNDMLHVDNLSNETTAGTAQDVDDRYCKLVRQCRMILVQVIDRLATIAPVDIVVIPGNHDTVTAWGVGEMLHCWFHSSNNVTIMNSPSPRKYYIYHNNLIGFAHGDKEKVSDLVGLMALEEPKGWGSCLHRRFHIGHMHQRKSLHWYSLTSNLGVVTQVLGSLAGTDAWHAGKGFKGIHSSQGFVWHKEDGCVAEFVYTPDVEEYS